MKIRYYDFKRENSYGFDVVSLKVTEELISCIAYKLDTGDIDGSIVHQSLSGRNISKIGECEIPISRVREYPKFSDMFCFGISPLFLNIYWVDINRTTRPAPAYFTLLNEGYIIKVVVPDTESTFLDCIICAPKSFAGDPFYVISNLDGEDATGRSEIADCIPKVNLEAPSEIEEGEVKDVIVHTKSGYLHLDSLYNIYLNADCGYLSKRKIKTFVDTDTIVKVSPLLLEEGDIINITAEIPSYGILDAKKIRVIKRKE